MMGLIYVSQLLQVTWAGLTVLLGELKRSLAACMQAHRSCQVISYACARTHCLQSWPTLLL